jgi:3-oxoacyl-[acyl-carrier-protein] synthase II
MPLEAERIAITGLGTVSALARDSRSTFAALCNGTRGIAPLSLFDARGLACSLAAEVRGLGEEPGVSRTDSLTLVAAREALDMASVRPGEARLGLALGGTTGGLFETEREIAASQEQTSGVERARRFVSHPLSNSLQVLSDAIGPFCCAASVCSACSSGAVAIVLAAHWLLRGRAELVLAGGAEGLCRMTYAGFSALGVVDPEPSRPFDAQRAGLTLGEGAGFLVLEREAHALRRGAKVLGWLSGWAVGAEAHHVTHPEPSGERASALMLEAITRAGLTPRDIDYVNAHGTGTRANDAMEVMALRRTFGLDLGAVRVSSSKAQLGHTLGAAGAIEAVVSVLALENGCAPPTVGLESPEANDVRHVLRAEPAALRAVASNSFGFGGMSAVLVFEHAEAKPSARHRIITELVVSAAATLGRELHSGAACATLALAEPGQPPFTSEPLSMLEPERSRRFDRASALATQAAQAAFEASGVAASSCGLVVGSAYGSVERSLKFIERLLDRGLKYAPPADFPQLVPSAVAGNAALYLRLQGPVFSVGERETSGESAFESGASLLELGAGSAMLVGAVEAYDSVVFELAPKALLDRSSVRSEGAGFLLLEQAEGANARGHVPLARLTAHEQERGTPLGSAWAAPRAAHGAKLVVAGGDSALEALLDESPWAGVERIHLRKQIGFFEAGGAVGLALGAALVARGASEVLVVSAGSGVRYVVRFERPEPA